MGENGGLAGRIRSPGSAVALAVALGLLWFALSGNRAWGFGLPAIVAVVWISQVLAPLPALRLSPVGLARFLAHFLAGSLAGGVDVARRALSPRLPLEIVRHEYRLGLPPGPARAVFAGVVTLLPGTLSVRLRGDALLVHSLAGDPAERLQVLERRVADLFGHPVPERP